MTDLQSPPSFTITCRKCGTIVPSEPWSWRHQCGGTLDLNLSNVTAAVTAAATRTGAGLTRFAPVIPLQSAPDTSIGDTPLAIEDMHGVRLGLKLEHLSPGGSFKDRGAYVTVARCVELGVKSIVVDSSGNAGVSIAMVARRMGIGVDVFLPRSTPEGKRQLLRILGARLHEVDGDRMQVQEETLVFAEAGAAYAGHWWNPYFAHGVKTMAYETSAEMPLPDYVFAPVGAGTVLLGLHTGYSELLSAGHIPTIPRLIAVQAAGYCPIASDLGAPDGAAKTAHLADGIAIADPPRRQQIVDAVVATDGFGIVVNDDDIAAALSWLLHRGYIVEPTSAVPLAGLMHCIREGRVTGGQQVLVPLTGTGMKVLPELAHVT